MAEGLGGRVPESDDTSTVPLQQRNQLWQRSWTEGWRKARLGLCVRYGGRGREGRREVGGEGEEGGGGGRGSDSRGTGLISADTESAESLADGSFALCLSTCPDCWGLAGTV